MWDTLKDIMNSFLGVFVIVIGLIFIPEIRKRKRYWITAIAIGIFMFWLGWDKIKRDNIKDADNQTAQKNIQAKLTADSANLDSTKRALREIDAYLHNLDSIGIKRNPNNNMPIISKNFTNYIGHVDKLDEH